MHCNQKMNNILRKRILYIHVHIYESFEDNKGGIRGRYSRKDGKCNCKNKKDKKKQTMFDKTNYTDKKRLSNITP